MPETSETDIAYYEELAKRYDELIASLASEAKEYAKSVRSIVEHTEKSTEQIERELEEFHGLFISKADELALRQARSTLQ